MFASVLSKASSRSLMTSKQQHHAFMRIISSSTATTTGSTFSMNNYHHHDKQQQTQSIRSYVTNFHLPDHTGRLQPSLTKIVATIGPTSEQEGPLQTVTAAGMNIMRLNFSHATKDEVELRIKNVNTAVQNLYQNQQPVGILLDTKGPEIRTGKLQNDTSGHHTITLEQGQFITLHTDDATRDAGSNETDLYIDYPYLAQAVTVGNQVLLDDGAVILSVVETSNQLHGTVKCMIQNTATLRSRAGVNLPLADTSDYLPALSDKDKADILYGMSKEVDIDYIAASFVQSAQGVRDIKSYVEQCAKQLHYKPNQPRPLIISKIETASSLQQFDDILKESDAIMVARGDLGVEIPLQQVTNAQKEMIAACNQAGKPCIVATQMLESMTKNPRPTRAEVADVTNAVYDGADAVMTSGETAKGKYPADTIQFMQNILMSAEEYMSQSMINSHPFENSIPNSPNAVVAAAAVTAANRTEHCQAIVVLDAMAPTSESHYTNLTTLVAAYRPTSVPIIAVCRDMKTARQLALYRGIRPVIMKEPSSTENMNSILQHAKELYHLESQKPIVIVSSTNVGSSVMNITHVP